MEGYSIVIYGIRITEPLGTLTDLMVTGMCLWAFLKLLKLKRTDLAFKYFNWFFLTMAIATFFGGILGHAFIHAINFAWKLPGWLTSMFSIALLERASIKHAKKYLHPYVAKFYEIANIVELIAAMCITFTTLDFFWVEMHTGFGMLAVITPVQLYTFIRTKDKGSFMFLAAVSVALISAYFFMNKISYNEAINYMAISHFFMAIASYVFYLAAKKVISIDYVEVKNEIKDIKISIPAE
jgi:hypothetical protein